jgi:CheY-like chemotaxis protein
MEYREVLYVEDDIFRSEIIKEQLRPLARVAHARDQSTAIRLISRQNYDLYLIDCEFPREDFAEPEILLGCKNGEE